LNHIDLNDNLNIHIYLLFKVSEKLSKLSKLSDLLLDLLYRIIKYQDGHFQRHQDKMVKKEGYIHIGT